MLFDYFQQNQCSLKPDLFKVMREPIAYCVDHCINTAGPSIISSNTYCIDCIIIYCICIVKTSGFMVCSVTKSNISHVNRISQKSINRLKIQNF